MGSRRRAREAAIQMLYQMDVSNLAPNRVIYLFWSNLGTSVPDDIKEFANQLVRGFSEYREAIDKTICSVSQNWRLARMACVDRNIIRLAVYELLMLNDVPRNVTINEAIELAKQFGDESSPSFVNGVLDRIALELGKR